MYDSNESSSLTSCRIKEIHFNFKRNVCCHYISSYIMINKYCCYTSSCISVYIFMYQEIFVVIIYSLI